LEFVAGILTILLAVTVRIVHPNCRDHPFSIVAVVGLCGVGYTRESMTGVLRLTMASKPQEGGLKADRT
jgi:hypothetical protein